MQVYIGIDWSEKKHDAVFVNEAAAVLAIVTFEHTPQGLAQLESVRRDLDVDPQAIMVGLETAHNLLIDYLWARNYTQVYVVPPSVVKGSRQRYRQSGARTDQSDAELLANLLRTDRHRLQPWGPDSLLTRQLRSKISLHIHLTRSCVRLSNRLRAVLLRYYPAALEVFYSLASPITLEFIQAFPTPQDAATLSFEAFQHFARHHKHARPQQLPARYARLQAAQIAASPDTVLVCQGEAITLAALLLTTMQAKKANTHALSALFAQHPDQAIFASLPGTGDFLQPGLLVKFGDDRRRFPTPGSLQALAGTCPVTDQSGKRKVIRFRRACDRDFRNIAQQWARSSLKKSVWANTYYQQVRPGCRSDNHAYRCLANRWLAIAWKLWQTKQPYDEAYHMQQRLKRAKPK
ncbi:MAG: IS110 family transposase [Anaerolineales bacterium]